MSREPITSTNAELVREWHPTRNLPLTPERAFPGSKRKIWWVCPTGHEYQAALSNRALNGTSCSVCSGKTVLAGFNDLATLNPELAREFHPTKNYPETIHTVLPNTGKKLWWVCAKGHEFEATGGNRNFSKSGCPICANKVVIRGVNDLATSRPELAQTWHPTLNGELTPSEVTAGSGTKVWWQCPADPEHVWLVGVSQRSSAGRETGCPFCGRQKVLSGNNDLASTRPEIARLWHPTKNGDLSPSDVLEGANKKVWWQCDSDETHEYEMVINRKTSTRGQGCPICSQKLIVPGVNDLATTFPDLMSEWDFEKNTIDPSMISHGSKRSVWWICAQQHSWAAAPNTRTNSGNGCPICSNQKVLHGFNDLATSFPEIAAQWHPTLNGDTSPKDVIAGSNKKYWWQCATDSEHVWKTSPGQRVTGVGTGCPACAQTGFDRTKPGYFYILRNEKLSARKVGITNVGIKSDRLAAFRQHDWEIIKLYEHQNGYVISELEMKMLRWIRKDLGLPAYLGKREMKNTGGQTETFSADGPSDHELISKADEILYLIISELVS